MPMWLTVNISPAPAASSGPLYSLTRSARWESMQSVPASTIAPSNAIAPPSAYAEWLPVVFVSAAVTASSARPPAVSAIPAHSLRRRWKPNHLSAATPSTMKPLARTAWTRTAAPR